MKLKRQASVLKGKAETSLVTAVEAFNSHRNEGRGTKVLLHLQHAFEMLLKAALVQAGKPVFDKKTGRSVGFERCIGLAMSDDAIKLSEADAGTLRAIDAMRDDEQHWFNEISEQILYLHVRAGVTLFDDILQRVFRERLSALLPARVLPVSAEPPKDLQLLLDDEYTQIQELLRPGRRAGHDARARIRTLLAMEAHVEPETRVSSKDVDTVVKGIRKGEPRDKVFPRLSDLAANIDGEGINLTVHITKKDGPPVRYVADEPIPAAAIRQVDLQKKYYLSAGELASKLGLTGPRAVALRRHLGIDDDDTCRHDFQFGSQRHRQYSDNALTRMRHAAEELDMGAVWEAHSLNRRVSPRCALGLQGILIAVSWRLWADASPGPAARGLAGSSGSAAPRACPSTTVLSLLLVLLMISASLVVCLIAASRPRRISLTIGVQPPARASGWSASRGAAGAVLRASPEMAVAELGQAQPGLSQLPGQPDKTRAPRINRGVPLLRMWSFSRNCEPEALATVYSYEPEALAARLQYAHYHRTLNLARPVP
jgi:hypothetical protein